MKESNYTNIDPVVVKIHYMVIYHTPGQLYFRSGNSIAGNIYPAFITAPATLDGRSDGTCVDTIPISLDKLPKVVISPYNPECRVMPLKSRGNSDL